MELQYCTLTGAVSREERVDYKNIENWNASSLYIFMDRIDEFYREYRDIFGNGLYSNLEEGMMDIYGINYYDENQVWEIIEQLKVHKPKDYEKLLSWLLNEKNRNGIYLLGI